MKTYTKPELQIYSFLSKDNISAGESLSDFLTNTGLNDAPVSTYSTTSLNE